MNHVTRKPALHKDESQLLPSFIENANFYYTSIYFDNTIWSRKNETPSVCKMVLLISSSALAPFRPPSTLDESLKEPSRLSDRIVVCDYSSSKAFVPIFHFQTSSFWKVTDLFLCIDEREEAEERGFFPIASLLLAIFCIRLFDNLPKCLIKERAMLEVPHLLHPGQNVNKLTKPHVWA